MLPEQRNSPTAYRPECALDSDAADFYHLRGSAVAPLRAARRSLNQSEGHMCTGKNQTKEPALTFLEKVTGSRNFRAFDADSPRGWGIFMVAAPERGQDEFDDVIVPDLTYPDCVFRGQHATLFQWIPAGVEVEVDGKRLALNSLEDLEAIRTSCHMDDTCRGGCVMGCFCWSTDPLDQRCRKNPSRLA